MQQQQRGRGRDCWCCETLVAFVLKLLIFLQTFVGLSIIVYSAHMLHNNQWRQQHHHHVQFPHIDTAPAAGGIGFHSLPAPWFIYASMGVGILVCCISCIGHIAAEAINASCLCFYALLTTIFLLLEVGLIAFIALDHHWQKDIPIDPTGELENIWNFIKDNVDVFQWIGTTIVVIQVLSLLFAIILRSMVSGRSIDEDNIVADYGFWSSTREPLLNYYSSQASGSTRGDSDIWSSRMREKYGLNSGEPKHNLLSQNSSH